MSSDFKPTKITPEKFEAIKKAFAETGLQKAQVSRKYNVGKSTLTIIRACDSYEDYVRAMLEKKARKQTKRAEKNNVEKVVNYIEKKEDETLNHNFSEVMRCLNNLDYKSWKTREEIQEVKRRMVWMSISLLLLSLGLLAQY